MERSSEGAGDRATGATALQREQELTEARERLERLERIVAGWTEAIAYISLDGTVTYWNPAAELMFGLGRDEIVGRPCVELLVQAGDDPARPRLRPLGHEVVRYETLRRRGDGSVFQLELSCSPVYDPHARLMGWVAIARDVTERTLVEGVAAAVNSRLDPRPALTEFADVLQRFVPFDHLTLRVIEGDHVRRLVSIGTRAAQYPEGEVHPLAGTSNEMAMQTKAPVIVEDTAEGRFSTDPGLAAWEVGSYVTVPLLDGDDVFAVFNVVFPEPLAPHASMVELLTAVAGAIARGVRNILVHERQREAVRRLEQLDRMRNDFVAMIVHELRSPLTSVIAYADLLRRHAARITPEELASALEVIETSSRRLAGMVDHVLQVAVMEADVIRVEMRAVDLNSVVERARHDLDGGNGQVRVDPGEIPPVRGDADRLGQVVSNLLTNAVKFSPGDTPIHVRTSSVDGTVTLAVQDEGIGIEPDDISLLFQRFARVAQPGVVQPITGTGLGLYICRAIVEAHGGRIWAESAPGVGSTFYVSLPASDDS